MYNKKLYNILLLVCLCFAAGGVTYAQTFPVIAGVSSSAKTALSGTIHIVNLPAEIQAGDLILIFWTDASTSGTQPATPNGFTQLYSNSNGGRYRIAWYKIADGSEAGTISVTAGAERSAHTSYRILSGTFQGNPEASEVITNTNRFPNPPSFSPSWGSYKNLWIAASHSDGDNGSASPTGYEDSMFGYTLNTGTSHAKTITAHKFNETATESPDEFSLQNSRNWAAVTVAIKGANINPPYKPVLRIMPLGDSITNGATGSSTQSGYRKILFDSLTSQGYVVNLTLGRDINFVGSDNGGNGDFDRDNEGHGGYKANDLIVPVGGFIAANPPDIILLHIGTNDIDAGDTPANLVIEVESLLDIIYEAKPDATVILAKIINRAVDNPVGSIAKTNQFNNLLETMAVQRISDGDKLYLVDAGEEFDYINDMYDNLHPNDSGYAKIARVWFNQIKKLLTPKLVSPADESINQPGNVTFTWNTAFDSANYHLQVATSVDFNSASLVVNDSTITDTSVQKQLLEGQVQYYWRVRAKINTGYSPFSKEWKLTTILPVELSAFNVKMKDNNAELTWQTETEVNNFGFDIERKTPKDEASEEWEKIGFVEGYGNSNSPKEYSFIDNNLFGGNKFYYRLKQIDNDGTFTYSDEVELNFLPDKFELFQNYPNPFNPVTNIEYTLPHTSNIKIEVYDLLGQHIQTLVNKEMEAGSYKVIFDAGNLPGGIYIYRIITDNFSQSGKMILLK